MSEETKDPISPEKKFAWTNHYQAWSL